VALMLDGKMVALAPPRELRETGLSGTLLEVETDAPQSALELLPRVPGVREVTLYGAVLHVLVDGLSGDDLSRTLREHGQRVIGVRPIRPSLEDVFVSRIRGAQQPANV
jgi:ABC-2 type transport system ATP-binding protein